MNIFKHFLLQIIFVFVIIESLPGQIIGLSFGTGVFDGEDNIYIQGRSRSIPKNFNIHVQSIIRKNVKLNLSAGYGYSTNYDELNSNNIFYNTTYKTTTKGYPIEGEILIFNNMINMIGIEPFIGLGIGYYKYDEDVKFTILNISTIVDSKTDGFAQYFTFGLNLYITKKLSSFIQIKKLGLSWLGQEVSKPDSPFGNAVKQKAYVVSKSGTQDLGISFGCLIYL